MRESHLCLPAASRKLLEKLFVLCRIDDSPSLLSLLCVACCGVDIVRKGSLLSLTNDAEEAPIIAAISRLV